MTDTQQTPASLTNHFLVSMPNLADPNFSQTITYICEHSSEGAMGIVINRSAGITLNDVLNQLNINTDGCDNKTLSSTVMQGGPMQTELGLILHHNTQHYQSTLEITEHIALTTSADILEAIAHKQAPINSIVALGYAGWGPGQLEAEMELNAWFHCIADSSIMFNTSYSQRFRKILDKMGMNLHLVPDADRN